VSAIVLWEVAKLAQLGRIVVDLDDPDVVRTLARVHVWPLTREIASTSTRLDVRGDPADELIAATSIVHKVPLVTRDRALLKSKLVPLAR
jgi:PIN domain nuclease of toxin-antitoxin system